jgi:Translation initiation factor IF-2, N-terminal region.
MDLPNDPMMLFSFINTKLRDEYDSLNSLCEDLGINQKELIDKLKAAGFEYNVDQNKFW